MNCDQYLRLLGKRIRTQRLKLEMSQAELASKINKSVVWISQIELGHANLSMVTLLQIAETLHIRPKYLV